MCIPHADSIVSIWAAESLGTAQVMNTSTSALHELHVGLMLAGSQVHS